MRINSNVLRTWY